MSAALQSSETLCCSDRCGSALFRACFVLLDFLPSPFGNAQATHTEPVFSEQGPSVSRGYSLPGKRNEEKQKGSKQKEKKLLK